MSDYISKSEVLDILYNTFEEYNMTTDKQDKHGGFGAEVFERVKDIPTLDEKEIIRKAFERVLERLEDRIGNLDNKNKICMDVGDFKSSDRFSEMMCEVIKCKEIVKEEGGIE